MDKYIVTAAAVSSASKEPWFRLKETVANAPFLEAGFFTLLKKRVV